MQRQTQIPCGDDKQKGKCRKTRAKGKLEEIDLAIMVVGSVAFDSLETPSGKRERVLGGAATHFACGATADGGAS